jgi:hypothetical protein
MRLVANLYPDAPRQFEVLGKNVGELCVQFLDTRNSILLIFYEERVRLVLD